MSKYAVSLIALRRRSASVVAGHPSVPAAALVLAATAVWAPGPTAAATAPAQPAETTTATVHDLGLGPNSQAKAVDGSIVVGTAPGRLGGTAYAYDLGAADPRVRDLGDLGGGNAVATAIDGKIVVGESAVADGSIHPFAYDLGAAAPAMLDLGTLGGPQGTATAVEGTIVTGWAETANGDTHPFAYDLAAADPSMADLGVLSGTSAVARAVDGNIVVGTSQSADRSGHAFVYDLGAATPKMRDIGTAGQASSATAISGPLVVGSFGPVGSKHAFAYDLGAVTPRMRDLGTLGGGPASAATAVDGNLVAGSSERSSGRIRAFAYDLGTPTPRMRGLGTLGGGSSSAAAVSGRIVVGQADLPGQSAVDPELVDSHAFAYDVSASEIVDLDTPEGVDSAAIDVDGNTVVGDTYDDIGNPHATAWTLSRTTRPAVRFSRSSYHVQENVATATVTVTRAGDPTPEVDAFYAVRSNSAGGGEDFGEGISDVVFAPGETEKSFTVRIFDDSVAEGAETAWLELFQPEGAAILGTPRLAGLVIAASDQQPDGLVSTRPSAGYVGENIYNTTGAGQTKTLAARRGTRRAFYVRVHNDGTVPNTITLRGSGSPPRSTVRYFRRSTNVTAPMRSAAGLTFHLRPGEFRQVRVVTTVGPRAGIGSLKAATVTGSWTGDGTRTDVVRTVVRVVR
jgi:probable HAF family extracellular repeat protein